MWFKVEIAVLLISGAHNCTLLFLAHTHIASLTIYTARWRILLEDTHANWCS